MPHKTATATYNLPANFRPVANGKQFQIFYFAISVVAKIFEDLNEGKKIMKEDYLKY